MKTETSDYTGCVIDGAISRSSDERVRDLLDFTKYVIEKEYRQDLITDWHLLDMEYLNTYKTLGFFEFWHEIEDDVIDLMNQALPDDVICLLHPDDPGSIVVWDMSDEED